MQVENHKEEVPFSYYEEKFQKLEPGEVTARLKSVKWDGKEFYVNLLGVTYAIAHPAYGIRKVGADASIRPQDDEGIVPYGEIKAEQDGDNPSVSSADSSLYTREPMVCPLPVQTFLLRYLLESRDVTWLGQWKTFREMPWGELYIQPYTGRVLTRAAFTFGTRVAAFRSACEKMNAQPLDHGDAGYQFQLIGGYWMQIMVWEGDDEFPPNAQVLYSDNFEEGFAPEDRVVAGDILISAIKGNM